MNPPEVPSLWEEAFELPVARRVRLLPYWMFTIVMWGPITAMLIFIVTGFASGTGIVPIQAEVSAWLVLPTLWLTLRPKRLDRWKQLSAGRMRDVGKAPLTDKSLEVSRTEGLLIGPVSPFIVIAFALLLAFMPGQNKVNRFGPNPRKHVENGFLP